mmetsp:Transcript_11549/g.29642  ORF Transcript_11549/g.29642 Transcript_11549/m.29642 type:complete len:309 (-) Transcript_11549:295-1221(-)
MVRAELMPALHSPAEPELHPGLDFSVSPTMPPGLVEAALTESVEPLADSVGPTSPSLEGGGGGWSPGLSIAYSGDDFHPEVGMCEDLHPEVDLDLALAAGGGTNPAVPDVASETVLDEALLRDLHDLQQPAASVGDAATVKSEPGADSLPPIKPDPDATGFDSVVPVLTPAIAVRPNRGPKSRTKVQETIRDEIDATIYSLFPMEALKMPRESFKAWRDAAGIRKLTGSEQRRLSEIRRMLRARVFAERTRIRKLVESRKSNKTLSSLRSENTKLKKRVAFFEATQSKLQARIKRLLAEKKATATPRR